MKSVELLSPAGTLKNMHYAFAYGADAVYAGQPRYSLRVRNNDFDLAHLKIGIDAAHGLGKKFFVASNILPHNAKIKTYLADMEPVIQLKPDALIMADPGLIMMVKDRWPDVTIHLSVQANTVNFAAVKFWQRMGISRVILSRELSLDEITEIRQECPDIELETFIHGALCIAYSGRCLLSGYFNHRDPNQGTCTNACRWEYKVAETTTTGTGDVIAKAQAEPVMVKPPASDQVYLIEEASRPGEQMPIYEDEHGTYIMNSKDLRAVQHVGRLIEIGVDSLKIEGRTKSHYYVARTAQIYRKAIDAALAGQTFDFELLRELDNLSNRGYTEGFYRRHVPQDYQNYEQGASFGEWQQFVGEITSYDAATGLAEVDVKNKFGVGDALEVLSPNGNSPFRLEYMQDLSGNAMGEALGGGYRVRIPLPERFTKLGLLVKNLKNG